MIYHKTCECGIAFITKSHNALYCEDCRTKKQYERTKKYQEADIEKTRKQKRESAQRRRGTIEATRPCRTCKKLHTFSSTKFLVCPSCREEATKRAKADYEERRRIAKGIKPRVLLSEEEKRARLLARKAAWNEKVRNAKGITERKIARVKKLKKLTEIKEKKPEDYEEKNTDIPVYKNKSVDIEHRRFTNQEQRMIDEFLAKQHRNCD